MLFQRLTRRCIHSAYTLVEVLVVIAIIGILAALLLPVISQAKAKAQRIQCVSGLRQMGVAFHSFAHDHNSAFPMKVPARDGGSAEFFAAANRLTGEFYFNYRHFQVLSNQLGNPKVLACASDRARAPAVTFANFDNQNLSYFVSASADFSKPNSVLAGDRNITDHASGNASLIHAPPGWRIYWTAELHRFKGNLLFSDGHVYEANSLQLPALDQPPGEETRLLMPSVKSAPSPGQASSSPSSQYTPPPAAPNPRVQSPRASSRSASEPAGALNGTNSPASPSKPYSPVASKNQPDDSQIGLNGYAQGGPPASKNSSQSGTVDKTKTLPSAAIPTNSPAPELDPVVIDHPASVTLAARPSESNKWWIFLLVAFLIALTAYFTRRMKSRPARDKGRAPR